MSEVQVDPPGADPRPLHHPVDVALLGKGELAIRRNHGDAVAAIRQRDGRLARNVARAEDNQVAPTEFVRVRDVLADAGRVLELAGNLELARVAAHADGKHHAPGQVLALVGGDLEAVIVATPLDRQDRLELADVRGEPQLDDLAIPVIEQFLLVRLLAEQARPVVHVGRLHEQGLALREVADELGRALLLDDDIPQAELLASVCRPQPCRPRADYEHVQPGAPPWLAGLEPVLPVAVSRIEPQVHGHDVIDDRAAAVEPELDQRRARDLAGQVQPAHVRLTHVALDRQPTGSRGVEAPVEEGGEGLERSGQGHGHWWGCSDPTRTGEDPIPWAPGPRRHHGPGGPGGHLCGLGAMMQRSGGSSQSDVGVPGPVTVIPAARTRR